MSLGAFGDEGVYDVLADRFAENGWWTPEQVAEAKELAGALMAETVYQNGDMAQGISVAFLGRMRALCEFCGWQVSGGTPGAKEGA